MMGISVYVNVSYRNNGDGGFESSITSYSCSCQSSKAMYDPELIQTLEHHETQYPRA